LIIKIQGNLIAVHSDRIIRTSIQGRHPQTVADAKLVTHVRL